MKKPLFLEIPNYLPLNPRLITDPDEAKRLGVRVGDHIQERGTLRYRIA